MGDWLKTAMDAMGQPQAGQPAMGQPAMGQPPAGEGEAPVEPQPTPTTAQRVQTTRAQQAEVGAMAEVSVPDAARRALPALNQALHLLTSELASMDDMRLPEDAARALAIEIMAEWLAASRKGTVSDLASVVARSQRVQGIVSSIR